LRTSAPITAHPNPTTATTPTKVQRRTAAMTSTDHGEQQHRLANMVEQFESKTMTFDSALCGQSKRRHRVDVPTAC
jgi:hypothetical protein